MRWDPRVKGLWCQWSQPDDHHRQHGDEDENLKRGRDLPDHRDAAHVDPGEHGNQRDRDQVVLPPSHLGEVVNEVIGERDGVSAAEQKRCSPVPPTGEKSPEVAEGGASPAVEAAFDGHRGREFRRYQRYRDAPEERQDQKIKQRHAGAGGGDHVLQPEGAPRAVREHDPDEVEQARFTSNVADGRLRLGAGGAHGCWLALKRLLQHQGNNSGSA